MTPAVTGRPAYHPATLLKLYVYGYLNRVPSSRRLEREAGRNVEVMWLTAMNDGYWTYNEWVEETVRKIVRLGLATPAEHQADYLNVQIRLAIAQALRHGRSGSSDDDPVTQ